MTNAAAGWERRLGWRSGAHEHVANRAADRGNRTATVTDLTEMLGDTRASLLISGGLLMTGGLGVALAALRATRWGGAELALLGPLGLLLLLGWLRAAVLLALADRPVADALSMLRWRTGAPVDLMVPWIPSGLDRISTPDPAALHVLIAGTWLRQERSHRALRWAVTAGIAAFAWSMAVLAWAAIG
jgi:hypothetical protein